MPSRFSSWQPVYYQGSGNYIVASGGQKICRYDADTLYFWDTYNRREIGVARADFMALFNAAPNVTVTAPSLGVRQWRTEHAR